MSPKKSVIDRISDELLNAVHNRGMALTINNFIKVSEEQAEEL